MAVQIPLFVSRPRPWINSISCRIDRPDPGKLEPVVGSQQLTDGTINFFPCFGLYERLVDLSNRLIGSVQGGELLVLLLECTVLFTELRLPRDTVESCLKPSRQGDRSILESHRRRH